MLLAADIIVLNKKCASASVHRQTLLLCFAKMTRAILTYMHMNWSLIDNLSLSLSQKTRKPPRNKRSKESTVFRGRKVAALPTLKSPGAHALGDVVAAAFINSDRKE